MTAKLNFTVKKYTSKSEIEQACHLARKFRLYSQPDWCLIDNLRYPEDLKCIALAFVGDTPIGVAIHEDRYPRIQVFVRKALRNNGVGSELVNAVKTEESYGMSDSPSEGRIFEYNGIRVQSYY